MPLDAGQARRFYDRVGRWQDTQRFYEHAVIARLVAAGDFAGARAVFELGCGTGRFADSLLARELSGDARYLGVDVSPVMVTAARRRLARWESRAEIRLLDPPALVLPGADASFDRFVAAYVFDLLSDGDASALIAEAHRLLAPGGLLALASLTPGITPTSRVIANGWGAIARRSPRLVGGCRPIELRDLVEPRLWTLRKQDVVVSWGVPSEALVAVRREIR